MTSAPMASCSPASRRMCCPWRSAISCSEMLRASRVQSGAIVSGQTIDTITLDHQARHRRRMAMTSDGGLRFLLDLARRRASPAWRRPGAGGRPRRADQGGAGSPARNPRPRCSPSRGTRLADRQPPSRSADREGSHPDPPRSCDRSDARMDLAPRRARSSRSSSRKPAPMAVIITMATDASQAFALAQLDVADISGRRLCLFAWARMGDRGGHREGRRASLRDWIGDLITHGSGWNDAVLFSQCWSDMSCDELNELALALCASQERFLETTSLGRAFCIAANSFLLPSWEKADAAQRRPEEGAIASDGHLSCGNRPLTRFGPDGPRRPLPQGEREVAYPIAAGTGPAKRPELRARTPCSPGCSNLQLPKFP